jgi:hypothetical protein
MGVIKDDTRYHWLLTTRVDEGLFQSIAADAGKYGLSYSDVARLRLRSGFVQEQPEKEPKS